MPPLKEECTLERRRAVREGPETSAGRHEPARDAGALRRQHRARQRRRVHQNQRDKLLPYTVNPRDVTPGIPVTYATTLTLDGFATGVLVRVNDGRPSKVEGNPEHPASLGATGALEEAAVLSLYDPERARGRATASEPRTSAELYRMLAAKRPITAPGFAFCSSPRALRWWRPARTDRASLPRSARDVPLGRASPSRRRGRAPRVRERCATALRSPPSDGDPGARRGFPRIDAVQLALCAALRRAPADPPRPAPR